MEALIALAPAAFLGGLLSFLSPCVLPLVPAYLGFAAGLRFDELTQEAARARVVASALCFVLGFSCVFIVLGAAASALNGLLIAHGDILAQVSGVLIVLFGLMMLGVLPLSFFMREWRFAFNKKAKEAGAPDGMGVRLVGAFLLGLAFAFVWTPCIGPILGSILTLAATRESLGEGVFLLSIYAAGLGVPFILVALGVARALKVNKKLLAHAQWFQRGAGVLLVATGVLVFSGDLQSLGAYLLDWFPALGQLG